MHAIRNNQVDPLHSKAVRFSDYVAKRAEEPSGASPWGHAYHVVDTYFGEHGAQLLNDIGIDRFPDSPNSCPTLLVRKAIETGLAQHIFDSVLLSPVNAVHSGIEHKVWLSAIFFLSSKAGSAHLEDIHHLVAEGVTTCITAFDEGR